MTFLFLYQLENLEFYVNTIQFLKRGFPYAIG